MKINIILFNNYYLSIPYINFELSKLIFNIKMTATLIPVIFIQINFYFSFVIK